eukprot:INCI12191.3.p1 GENE.INCI12191.3~~INCI12191.3.p1  ORF type:complete len:202 (+),score=11.20 INCI12191.3:77-607(+)
MEAAQQASRQPGTNETSQKQRKRNAGWACKSISSQREWRVGNEWPSKGKVSVNRAHYTHDSQEQAMDAPHASKRVADTPTRTRTRTQRQREGEKEKETKKDAARDRMTDRDRDRGGETGSRRERERGSHTQKQRDKARYKERASEKSTPAHTHAHTQSLKRVSKEFQESLKRESLK